MKEWKTYKIADIVDEISMGPFGSNIKVENFISEGIPVLNGSNLQGYRLNEKSFNYVSEEKANSLGKANAYRGDVVITHRGTLGQIIYIPSDSKYERYVISQSQFRLKLKRNIVRPDFLVYYFHTAIGQHKILMNASQVGVPALARPTSTFREVTLPMPPMDIQNKIMDILLSIDGKLAVNKQINDNLEQQAQAIYKSWFVDFEPFKDGNFVESELGLIPEGWEVRDIYKYTDVIYGAPYKSSLFSENKEGYPLIRIRDLKSFAPQFYTQEILPQTEYIIAGDVVAGMDAEFTPYIWQGEKGVLNQRCCKFKGQYPWVSNYYLLNLLKPELEYVQSYKTGTTVSHLGKADIDRFKVITPPESIVKTFSVIVNSLLEQKIKSAYEIRNLTSTRDSLLPKLMSGELKINEIDC